MILASSLRSRNTKARSGRLDWLDTLRGLGILLMVLDHLLAVTLPSSILRYTLTRVSLPLLMFSSGVLTSRRPTSFRRVGEVLWTGAVGTMVFGWLGLGVPDPMFVAGVAMLSLSLLQRLSVNFGALLAVALGVTQFYAWRLPVTGYQPGVMASLMGAASLAGISRFTLLRPILGKAPGCIGWFGRHPLWVYLAHLPILLMVHELW